MVHGTCISTKKYERYSQNELARFLTHSVDAVQRLKNRKIVNQ